MMQRFLISNLNDKFRYNNNAVSIDLLLMPNNLLLIVPLCVTAFFPINKNRLQNCFTDKVKITIAK